MNPAQSVAAAIVPGDETTLPAPILVGGVAKLSNLRESQRLEALDHYDVMDSPPEEAFDSVTRLTRQVLGVPMAAISFVDGHREWFKSRDGLCDPQIARAVSLSEAVIEENAPLVVPDTAEDERFASHPGVTRAPHLRFYAAVPLHSTTGHVVGVLSAMDTAPRDFGAAETTLLSDLGRMATTVLELRLRTTLDPVTGVMSRGVLRAETERAVQLARRHRNDLSCMTVGIDHLQSIMGRHGNEIGNEMLRRCADSLQATLRASDVVGRIGGATFGILLPLTGKEGARDAAERVRAAIGEIEVALGANKVPIFTSIGLATFDAGMRDGNILFEEAEAGLFHARQHGGNRIIPWPRKAAPGSQMRRRVFKAGRIESGTESAGLACTVRSLSGHHATLDVNDGAAVPSTFALRIPADSLRIACRVVLREPRQVEVEIV